MKTVMLKIIVRKTLLEVNWVGSFLKVCIIFPAVFFSAGVNIDY
jgi:hypothetical protein